MHDVYAKQLAVAADGQATELAGALRELHSLQAALVADLASLMSRAIADHEMQLATERNARALAERETSELLEAAEALEMQAHAPLRARGRRSVRRSPLHVRRERRRRRRRRSRRCRGPTGCSVSSTHLARSCASRGGRSSRRSSGRASRRAARHA
eukprot:scaffold45701_cov36-Phaeocystis_antarctica.AAC.1